MYADATQGKQELGYVPTPSLLCLPGNISKEELLKQIAENQKKWHEQQRKRRRELLDKKYVL